MYMGLVCSHSYPCSSYGNGHISDKRKCSFVYTNFVRLGMGPRGYGPPYETFINSFNTLFTHGTVM